jgi:alpha-tubulin suppressor-like RCC1 family protein
VDVAAGAKAVNTRAVTLDLVATGADEMRVTNGGSEPTGPYRALTATMSWNLSAGDGTKTVSVQYRNSASGAVSEVVSDTVVLDTSPPRITQSLATDGQHVDLSTGALFAIGGTVNDDGSGIASVDVSTDGAPAQSAPATMTGADWTRTVGALTSGPQRFTATATDEAGNTATVSVGLDLTAPVPTGTDRLRSSTVQLDPAVLDDLVAGFDSTELLVFRGDLRNLLGNAAVVVGHTSDGTHQVMRRIHEVTYDAATNRTTVRTSPASLADAFLELHLAETVPTDGVNGLSADELHADVAAGDCDAFADRGVVGKAVHLDLQGSVPAALSGGASSTDASVSGGIAGYVDVGIDVGWNMFGPTVNHFRGVAGLLVCGAARVHNEINPGLALGDSGWIRGVPEHDWIGSSDTVFSATTAPGLSISHDLLDGMEGVPIGSTGLTLKPLLPVGLSGQVQAGMDMSFGESVAVGGVFGYDTDSGLVKDTEFNAAELGRNGGSSSNKVTVMASVDFGLALEWGGAANAGVTVASIGVGHQWRNTVHWRSGIIGASSSIVSIDKDRCLVGQVGAKFNLTVGLDLGPVDADVNLVDVDITKRDLEYCYHHEHWTPNPAPPTITTAEMADGTTGVPYSTYLDAGGDASHWRISAGSLPSGLALDPVTGKISGTPTQASSSTFTVEVRDPVSRTASRELTLVINDPPPPPPPPVALNVSAGEAFTCAAHNTGTVSCSGWNVQGELGNGSADLWNGTPTTVAALTDATFVSAGGQHACALRQAGRISCWGDNYFGQLGDGTTTRRSTPVEIPGFEGATAVAAGGSHTCALRAGTVWCWGDNYFGQLGDGTTIDRTAPTQISGLSGVVALSAGKIHNCAVQASGAVWCWGANYEGQVGDGTTSGGRTRPVRVAGISASTVAAGVNHSCAVTSGAVLRCWGSNADGALGDSTTTDHLTPVAVTGVSDTVAVSAGGSGGAYLGGYTCALSGTGVLRCWGGNHDGQLGDGTRTARPTPAVVALPGPVIAFDTGSTFDTQTCALLANGTTYCWGANINGQLGNGSVGLEGIGPRQLTPLQSLL